MPAGDHIDTIKKKKKSEYLRFLVQQDSKESNITPFRFNFYIQNSVENSTESQEHISVQNLLQWMVRWE